MKAHHYLRLGLLWLALCSFEHSYATDYVWIGTTQAWGTGTNWSPVAPAGGPTESDNVVINEVFAPKVPPLASTSKTIRNLTIKSGTLNIGTNIVLTVLENISVTGINAKMIGAGRLTGGTVDAYIGEVILGDGVNPITIDPSLSLNCKKVVLKNSRFKIVTLRADEWAISDCSFTGVAALTKTGITTDELNGVVSFTGTLTFVNQGNGSVLFGNSGLDDFNFGSVSRFTNSGTGSMLFGNTDNDHFVFKNDVTFTQTGGKIEVARYGNSDVYADMIFTAAGQEIVFGNVGGGSWNVIGSATQRFSATATLFKFNKLTVDKGGNTNVAISIPIEMIPMPGATSPAPRLKLLNGLIGTSAIKVTIPDDTEIVMNSEDPSKSFVTGSVTKVGSSAFTFPIGKTTGAYRPISMSAPASGESHTFTAEYVYDELPFASSLSAEIVSISYCEYWRLVRDQGTSEVSATLYFDQRGCEVVQPVGLKFCRYNSVSKKWESLDAAQNNTTKSLTTNAPLSTYGYFAFGNSMRKFFLDTRSLDPVEFTVTGAQLPEGVKYLSGQSGLAKTIIPFLPVPPATGTSPILISIAEGPENEAMKISFDIDNTTSISNVKVSVDNSSTFVPLVSDYYTIDNTPSNGKRIVFLKGDEVNAPIFTTNLTDGMVMMNSTGANFQIGGLTTSTVNSFRILSLDNVLIREASITGLWDGTDSNGQEVPNGVYKFEVTLTNSGATYTYNGQVIVK